MKFAQRDYLGKRVNLDQLQGLIESFFGEEGFRTQSLKHPQGYIVQAKKGGIFRTILAANRAYTIIIEGSPSNFKIRIGVADWLKGLKNEVTEPFFTNPMMAYLEIPEALWSYELEHQMWHYIETQVDLGIQ